MIQAFTGTDKLAREAALKSAVDAYLGDLADDPQSREVLYADENYEGRSLCDMVEELAESLSLFSPKRAVIVRNIEKLRKADQEALCQYIPGANPDAGVFFDGEKLDARSAFAKTIVKALPKGTKKIPKFEPLKSYQIPQWIQEQAQNKYGRKMLKHSADFLHNLVGDDTTALNMELEKLADYAGDEKEITYEHIDKVVASQRPFTPFLLNEPFGKRDAKEFTKLLSQALRSGIVANSFVSTLYTHTSKLMQMQELFQQKVPEEEIFKRFNIPKRWHFSNLFKYDQQLGKRTPERYRMTLIGLAEIDHGLKTSRFHSIEDVERAFIEIL
jgi:DNA polymerase-3 subunit delta